MEDEVKHKPSDFEALNDLQRCDSYNPCERCNRCTEGGEDWHKLYHEWIYWLGCGS